jgi:aspartate carbamoyltransferase catalytic subunit
VGARRALATAARALAQGLAGQPASGDAIVIESDAPPPSNRRFEHRHLLSASDLSRDDAIAILDAAETFFEVSRRSVRKVPTLRGKTLLNVFFENSTRTRTSFELAGKRLSMDTVNLSGSSSSTQKGETLLDTIQTLEAMQPDVIVIRHAASGAPHYVAGKTRVSVVNAGDGTHEHPSQALLDAFTMRRAKLGKGAPDAVLGRDLEGLVVAICGDVLHSRVARSNAALLGTLGAKVRFVGPRTLLPAAAETLGAEVFDRLDAGLEGADVVMVLRIQKERLEGPYLPTTREYARTFGVSERRLGPAKRDAIVMHPGPMNRGVEIDPDLADGPRSVILDQVEAGVAVRMAILWLLANEG